MIKLNSYILKIIYLYIYIDIIMSDNKIKTNSTNEVCVNGDNDTIPMKKNTYNR